MMIGTADACAQASRATSSPSRPGRPRSSTTRSGVTERSRRNALVASTWRSTPEPGVGQVVARRSRRSPARRRRPAREPWGSCCSLSDGPVTPGPPGRRPEGVSGGTVSACARRCHSASSASPQRYRPGPPHPPRREANSSTSPKMISGNTKNPGKKNPGPPCQPWPSTMIVWPAESLSLRTWPTTATSSPLRSPAR